LQDGRDADQDYQQPEQLRQATISGKLVYRPKTDGADDNGALAFESAYTYRENIQGADSRSAP
jgi:hypothetical protein